MSAVITFLANQKGGAGKSTICDLLARAMHHSYRKRILVIDVDFQFTLGDQKTRIDSLYDDPAWHYDYEQKGIVELIDYIGDKEDEYDIIFIDTPGILNTPDSGGDGSHPNQRNELLKALKFGDIIICPLTGSEKVINSSEKFYRAAEELKRAKAEEGYDMEVWALFNMYEHNQRHSQLVANDFEMLKERGFTNIFKSYISKHVGYENTSELSYESILESGFASAKDKKQFSAFVKEFNKLTLSLIE